MQHGCSVAASRYPGQLYGCDLSTVVSRCFAKVLTMQAAAYSKHTLLLSKTMKRFNWNYWTWATKPRTGGKIIMVGRHHRTPNINIHYGAHMLLVPNFEPRSWYQEHASQTSEAPKDPGAILLETKLPWARQSDVGGSLEYGGHCYEENKTTLSTPVRR